MMMMRWGGDWWSEWEITRVKGGIERKRERLTYLADGDGQSV